MLPVLGLLFLKLDRSLLEVSDEDGWSQIFAGSFSLRPSRIILLVPWLHWLRHSWHLLLNVAIFDLSRPVVSRSITLGLVLMGQVALVRTCLTIIIVFRSPLPLPSILLGISSSVMVRIVLVRAAEITPICVLISIVIMVIAVVTVSVMCLATIGVLSVASMFESLLREVVSCSSSMVVDVGLGVFSVALVVVAWLVVVVAAVVGILWVVLLVIVLGVLVVVPLAVADRISSCILGGLVLGSSSLSRRAALPSCLSR